MALFRLAPRKITLSPLLQQVARANASAHAFVHPERAKIGNRDVVGHGINGTYSYVDHIAFPMPAVRWKENTPEVMALRDKEKGDWKKLSIEDKKALYRASFCQTYAEMLAPDGRWKSVVGFTLFFVSLSFWIYIWEKLYVYPPMPDTITNMEKKQAQLRRMIDMRVDPIDGLTSKWDYENNRWKK